VFCHSPALLCTEYTQNQVQGVMCSDVGDLYCLVLTTTQTEGTRTGVPKLSLLMGRIGFPKCMWIAGFKKSGLKLKNFAICSIEKVNTCKLNCSPHRNKILIKV
jgi:hypothetical protein